MVIQRVNLRDQVKQEILNRLPDGVLEQGTAINEVQLAAELGVSRTPLREALITLEQDGIIGSEAGKGFFWAPVSVREFKEITPIIAALEALALDQTPMDALAAVAPRLLAEARAFSSELAVHSELIRADDAWHSIFLDLCPNVRLRDLIASQKVALHRYESLVVPDDAIVRRVAREHQAIAQCIVDHDRDGAIDALRTNWINGRDRLVEQLQARLG